MKKLLKTTGIMMLGAAVLFTGCKKDKDEKFSVNATANNPEWGVVVGGGEFDEGTEIVLAATANEGYHFVKWSNELTDNPLKLVVTKNESLIAYFAEGNGGNPGGTSDPQSITLSGTINENTTCSSCRNSTCNLTRCLCNITTNRDILVNDFSINQSAFFINQLTLLVP